MGKVRGGYYLPGLEPVEVRPEPILRPTW